MIKLFSMECMCRLTSSFFIRFHSARKCGFQINFHSSSFLISIFPLFKRAPCLLLYIAEKKIPPNKQRKGKPGVRKLQQVEANFFRSKYGNAMLKDPEGFHYHRNKMKGDRIYWTCTERKHKCKVKVVTCGFYIQQITGSHTHTPSIDT